MATQPQLQTSRNQPLEVRRRPRPAGKGIPAMSENTPRAFQDLTPLEQAPQARRSRSPVCQTPLPPNVGRQTSRLGQEASLPIPVGEYAHIGGATLGGMVPHLIPLPRRIMHWSSCTDVTAANPLGTHKYLRTLYLSGIRLDFLYADFMQWITNTAYQRNWVLISASGNSDPLNPGKGWFAHLIFGAERMAHEAKFHLHKNSDHREHAITHEGFYCVLCKEATNLIKQQQQRDRRRNAGGR